MVITLVHLSDFHFLQSSESNPVLARTEQLANAIVKECHDSEGCYIIVTGDIANSGALEEYAVATTFFNELCKSISSRSGIPLELILIPGNHDCDFSAEQQVRKSLLKNLTPTEIDESIIRQMTLIQSNYYDFQETMIGKPFSDTERVLFLKECAVGAFKICFLAINSAWCSSVHEKRGALMLPDFLFQKINSLKLESIDLVVAMMHHPYSWFGTGDALKIRRTLDSSTDLIFTGHEHAYTGYRKESRIGEKIEYDEGAEIQDIDEEHKSGFSALQIEIDEKLILGTSYFWEDGLYRPDTDNETWQTFQRNRYRLRKEYVLTDGFEQSLNSPEITLTHPYAQGDISLNDLFIYPDLRQLNGKVKYNRKSSIIKSGQHELIKKNKFVAIIGDDDSGKTTLVKKMFTDLRTDGIMAVILRGKDITSHAEGTIKNQFRKCIVETYKGDRVEEYLQLDKGKKAIIIDDIIQSKLNVKGRAKLLAIAELYFGTVIVVGSKEFELDTIMTKSDINDNPLWKYLQLEILPLGHLKRFELIRKWTTLGREFTISEETLELETDERERIINVIIGKDYLPPYPLYILIMLNTIEAKIPISTTGASTGYLYEVLITTALARTRLDIGTLYTYLSNIAYHIHDLGDQFISEDVFRINHEAYCDEYQLDLSFDEMIKELEIHGILVKRNDSIGFRYLYFYFYFVGKYMSDNIRNTSIQEEVKRLTTKLYHVESANILMFLSHLSKDPIIIESLLGSAEGLFPGIEECDFDADTRFMKTAAKVVDPILLKDGRVDEHRKDVRRKMDVEEMESDDFYDEHDFEGASGSANLFLQINAAMKTIQITGQILTNYHGSIRGKQKVALIDGSIGVALRMLKFMYSGLEKEVDEYRKFLIEQIRQDSPDINKSEIKRKVNYYMFMLVEGFTITVLKYVSSAISHKGLRIPLGKLLEQKASLSRETVDLTIALDMGDKFPTNRTKNLYEKIKTKPFPVFILRHLVWLRFYLYHSREELRNRICDKIGIEVKTGVIYDESTKMKKRIK